MKVEATLVFCKSRNLSRIIVTIFIAVEIYTDLDFWGDIYQNAFVKSAMNGAQIEIFAH